MAQRTLVDHYEIRAELGAGSLSVVYLAYDTRAGRSVALKLLPRELMDDAETAERFEYHVQGLIDLDHPGIVPVYGFGDYLGQPYIVTRYMPGRPLSDQIILGPMSIIEAASYLDRLVPALAYAHQRGLIHRSLKPSNILFDQDGAPALDDLGMAQFSRPFARMSGVHILGSPAYVAPEVGRPGGITPLIDVYALGVLLFQMLTGQLPYSGRTAVEVLRAHIEQPIPNLRYLRPDLPDAVQQVILGALAKEPSDRYQSPLELQQNILNILNRIGMAPTEVGRAPIYVPPPEVSPVQGLPDRSVFETTPEWYDQNKLVEAGEPVHMPETPPLPAPPREPVRGRRRIGRGAERRAFGAWRAAQARRAGASELLVVLAGFTMPPIVAWLLIASLLAAAIIWIQFVLLPNWGATIAAVGIGPTPSQPPPPTATPTPFPVPDALPTLAPYTTVTGHAGAVESLAVAPDGAHFATGGADGAVVLWNWDGAAATQAAQLDAHSGAALALAYSPDGALLASGGLDGQVAIWDAAAVERRQTFTSHSMQVNTLAWSPDGRYLASGAHDGVIIVWDLAAAPGEEAILYRPLQVGPVTALAFRPDGVLAAATDDFAGTIRVYQWDFAAEPEGSPAELFTTNVAIRRMAYSADGRVLLLGTDESFLALDAQTGEVLPGTVSAAGLGDLALSPDGQRLLGGVGATAVSVYDTATGGRLRLLPQEGQFDDAPVVSALSWLPGGQMVLSGWSDGRLAIWDQRIGSYGVVASAPVEALNVANAAALNAPWQRLGGLSNSVLDLSFSTDGRLLLAGSQGGRLIMWDVNSGQAYPLLAEYPIWIEGAAIHPAGRILAAPDSSGHRVEIRDVATGAVLDTLLAHEEYLIWALEWSPDGSQLAAGLGYQRIALDDAICTEHLNCICRGADLTCLDGTVLAGHPMCAENFTATCLGADRYQYEGLVVIWELGLDPLQVIHTGQFLSLTAVNDLSFSPDGALLAGSLAYSAQQVVVWDAAGQDERQRFDLEDEVYDIDWGAGGTLAATHTGGVTLWDAASGEVVADRVLAGGSSPRSAAWVPGGLLAVGTADGRVLLLEGTGAEIAVLDDSSATGAVVALAVSADGRLIAAGGANGMVSVWGVTP
jgi:WD40 repeat protein/serine/threonine protein kinase